MFIACPERDNPALRSEASRSEKSRGGKGYFCKLTGWQMFLNAKNPQNFKDFRYFSAINGVAGVAKVAYNDAPVVWNSNFRV